MEISAMIIPIWHIDFLSFSALIDWHLSLIILLLNSLSLIGIIALFKEKARTYVCLYACVRVCVSVYVQESISITRFIENDWQETSINIFF